MRNLEAKLRRAWARCLRRGRARVCRAMELQFFRGEVILYWDDGCVVLAMSFRSVGELLDWMRAEGLLDD